MINAYEMPKDTNECGRRVILALAAVLCILASHANGQTTLPAEWPQGFEITVRESNGTVLAIADTILAWNENLAGYAGIVSDQDILYTGSSLAAMNGFFGGGTPTGMGTINLSGTIGGVYDYFDSSSGFNVLITFKRVLQPGSDYINETNIRNVCIGFAAGLIIHAWCWFAGAWARDLMRTYEALYR